MEYDSQLTQAMPTYARSRTRLGRLRARTSRRNTKKYPRYRQVTPYNTPYTFERNVEYDLYLNLSSGWNARGPGISLVWSLANLVITMGDGVIYSPAIPGASELSNLFDQWRIDRVDTMLFFSATNHQMVASGTNTYAQPIINIVTDYDNNSATENLLEFPQCRTLQLGSNRPIVHTVFKPGSVTTAETTGFAGATASKVNRGSWNDCAITDVAHFGMKLSYAQFNPLTVDYNPDVIAGSMKIRCKIYYTLRNPR